MDVHCPKCLTGRTGDVLGAACRTQGCDGVIAEQPSYRSLVDVLPEPMTCGRRGDLGPRDTDRWEKFKRVDNRVCSYCGSLHPDDMFRLVSAAATAGEDIDYHAAVAIEPSDKAYKIYVKQPDVRNAHEGGIKFYTHHLPRNADGTLAVSQEQQADYAAACRVSRLRCNRWMAQQFPARKANDVG